LKSRRGSGGWSWVVIMIALAAFAMVMTVLMFTGDQITAMVSGQPAFLASYDANSDAAMNLIFYPGIAIVVAFGAIIEAMNLNQKRTSGEEVI
jgi:hypothetical protein